MITLKPHRAVYCLTEPCPRHWVQRTIFIISLLTPGEVSGIRIVVFPLQVGQMELRPSVMEL